MARARWKFLPVKDNDLQCYYSKINPDYVYMQDQSRAKTVNLLTINRFYRIHQGSIWTEMLITKYSLGRKLGMFSKTRRPFFFRTKKKKR